MDNPRSHLFPSPRLWWAASLFALCRQIVVIENGQHPQQAPGDPGDPASACNFCLAGHHCCLSKHSESIIRSGRRLMAGTRKSVGRRWLWQGLSLTRGSRGQSFHAILCNNNNFLYRNISAFSRETVHLFRPLGVVLLFLIFLFNYSQKQNFTMDTLRERFSWSHLKSALKQKRHHAGKQELNLF